MSQFIIFFLIVFLILAIGCSYIGWRLIVPASLGRPWKALAWTLLILLAVLPPLTITLEVSGYEEWSDRLSWVSYVSIGFLSFIFTLLFIRDVAWLAAKAIQKLFALFKGTGKHAANANDPPDPGRRNMLIQTMNLGIIGAAAGLTAYGVFEARRRPAIKEIDISIKDLPEALNGFRIVQITDIHAGLTIKRDFIETIVGMVNELRADVIAFTGDMADGSVAHLRNDVEPFSRMKSKYGTYFVTGNHEYYSGVEQWVEEARRLGMKVLLNSHEVLKIGDSNILIAGVTDLSGGGFLKSHISDPAASVANAPRCDAKILLAHQPKSIHEASPLGFDLLISGHTHGGQFFPWNFAAALAQPYISGLHDHEGTWIYVSKGTGYWGPPVRLGTRSEITVFTLVRDVKVA
jgi:predicted MPP superfamily phosphohydrolase